VDGKLTSGVGNSSLTLTASFHFGQDSVAFNYEVGGHGLFSFFVDQEPAPRFRVRTSIPEAGVRFFSWIHVISRKEFLS
jgi:hypothetical protein